MKVTVTPDRLDIIPIREQILIMNASDASVTIVNETGSITRASTSGSSTATTATSSSSSSGSSGGSSY